MAALAEGVVEAIDANTYTGGLGFGFEWNGKGSILGRMPGDPWADRSSGGGDAMASWRGDGAT